MAEPEGRIIIKVGGRVLETSPSRSASMVRLEGSVEWWSALALLGGSLLVLGALVGDNLGSDAAIGGVMLFLATAVLAGSERYEPATVLGVSGVVWTSAGIAVYLRVDTFLFASFLAFALVGAVALVVGVLGTQKRRSGDRSHLEPAP